MKNLIFLAFCCAGQLTIFAQPSEKYASVRISLNGKNVADLARTGIETDHGEYYPGASFTGILSTGELARVHAAGFETTILVPDVLQHYLEQRENPAPLLARGNDCTPVIPTGPEYVTPANYTVGSMGGFLTYNEMLAELDKMRQLYPHLISSKKATSDTIVTWEGHPIYHVKISDNPDADEPEREVLYTALHHAREPNSAAQLIFFMWYLLENYENRPDIQALVNNLELYFVPCINVDGYLFNELNYPNGGGLWRKNRRDNGDGTFGVDLNRNYGFQWGGFGGSSDETVALTYRGPAPFSEPETRTIRDFCREHDFLFALNYHSYGNLLIYPWSYSDTLADSSFVFYSRHFTRENHFRFGTASQTVGYQVNGNSDDWLYAENGTYSFTPELGHADPGFWPQPNQIDGYNKDCLAQNFSMAYAALRYGSAQDLDGINLYGTEGFIDVELTRYGLMDGEITVSLEPYSANILSPTTQHGFNLPNLAKATHGFPYVLAPGIHDNDLVVFLLRTDNGFWVQTDTIRKIFNHFPPQHIVAINDSLSNTANWSGYWELTSETYHSAPTCLTDSPNELYPPGFTSAKSLLPVIHIPLTAQNANLRFFARWDIEEDWDYAWVLASSDGAPAQPLCGRYTEQGVNGQAESPIFDGQQIEWVEECMSLEDFVGKSLQLEFQLVADASENFDGFYLDDLVIEYTLPVSGVQQLSLSAFQLLQNEPNPAATTTTISWVQGGAQIASTANLLIFNALGETVEKRAVVLNNAGQTPVDVLGFAPGVYFYRLDTNLGQTATRKMLVQR